MIEIRKTDLFAQWLDNLRDLQARARIQARIERLAGGNPGDVESVAKGFRSYAFIMVPVIGCIFSNAANC
jgi:putative addiction module killer protein